MILTLGKMFSFKMPTVPGSGLPRPLNISAGLSLKGYWQTMNPKGGNYMGVGVNADLGVMASIGLDFDLSKKITNRNIILGIAVRDFLPTEIIWVHFPLGYKEKIRYSHYYGISYVDKAVILEGTGLLPWVWINSIPPLCALDWKQNSGISLFFGQDYRVKFLLWELEFITKDIIWTMLFASTRLIFHFSA
jgi:hypothetical protein